MVLLKRQYDPKSRELHSVPPFTELPDYYDEIFRGIDHQKVALHLLRVAQQQHLIVKRVTELGCRSGLLLHQLAERGIEITGIETTQQFVEWAHGFAEYKTVPAAFYLSNLKQALPIRNQEMVVCFNQNVNYFRTEKDLSLFLSMVRMMIATRGMFMFDVMTEKSAMERFSNYLDYDKITPGFYVHKAYYVEDTKEIRHHFELYPHDAQVMYEEIHHQVIWPLDTLATIVEDHGFKIHRIYGAGTFQEGTEEDMVVDFLCLPA